MALLKWTSAATDRAQDVVSDTTRQLQARSRYYAHMAAAQGHRAAAKADNMRFQTSNYVRRHPMATLGIAAGVFSLLSFLLYRRNKF